MRPRLKRLSMVLSALFTRFTRTKSSVLPAAMSVADSPLGLTGWIEAPSYCTRTWAPAANTWKSQFTATGVCFNSTWT